jgi:hypothetical protein
MAHQTHSTLDADASRLIRYLQRGGTKSYYTTFDADGYAHMSWYDSLEEPPAPPTGTDVYFGVNPCTAIPETNAAGKPAKPEYVRGRKDYIAALNCLYAEFDAKHFVSVTDDDARTEQAANGGTLDEARERVQERVCLAEPERYKALALAHVRSLPVQPTRFTDSGGGYHCWWLLVEPFVLDTPEKRQRAVDVQRDWTTFVRGDKAAKDIARVLRVPGTDNYKYEPARPVAFVEQEYSRTYTLDALQAMLPDVAPRKARTPRTNTAACHTDGLQPTADFVAISKAAAALAQLSTERRENYGDWTHVGMALRGLGDDGLYLWRRWSVASPKYNVGDCDNKWPTFQPGDECSGYTLASLYAWARDDGGEPVSTLDDAERRQLQDLQALNVQTQRILAMKAPMAAKAVIVGMLPRLDAKRVLVADKDGHTGSLAVNYGTFADIMNTTKKAVGKAVELGERAGLWRKDGEYKETNAGFEIKLMRLDLQPAFFRPELAEPIPETRGGTRAGAGRKPKCADCPPETRVIRKTEITYVCDGCGQVLDAEPVRFDVMPDDAPAAGEFKKETDATHHDGGELCTLSTVPPVANVETNAAEFKKGTEYIGGTTSVSFLKKTLDAELVPVALAETYELAAALRLADTYAPADDAERHAYKTGLTWLQRGEPAKAAAAAANVHDERAHATLLHLANRPPALAPGLRE